MGPLSAGISFLFPAPLKLISDAVHELDGLFIWVINEVVKWGWKGEPEASCSLPIHKSPPWAETASVACQLLSSHLSQWIWRKFMIKVSWDATLCIFYTSGLICPWLAFCLFILQFYHRIAHGYTLHYEVSLIGIHYQFLGKLLSAGCWTVCFQVSGIPLTGGQVALQRTHPFRLSNKSGGCLCDNLPAAPLTAYSCYQARSSCPHALSSHTVSFLTASHLFPEAQEKPFFNSSRCGITFFMAA